MSLVNLVLTNKDEGMDEEEIAYNKKKLNKTLN